MACADATPTAGQLGLTLGRLGGISPSEGSTGHDVRLHLEQRFLAGLGGGPELALIQLHGRRDDVDTSARGGALTYVLRWHALRHGASSAYLQFGWGGAMFVEPFPRGGTRFNGTSMFGAGVQLGLGRGGALRVDVREVHVSNGKGLVPENPAFDGVQLALGVAVWR